MKAFIVSFDRPANPRSALFVVIADNRDDAIDIAWNSGSARFQATHERRSGQAKELKRGALRIL
jgi:hypothetical protein